MRGEPAVNTRDGCRGGIDMYTRRQGSTSDVNGSLDLVVAGPEKPLLYMNRCGEGRWLRIEFRGAPGNSEGFGARVAVAVGGRTYLREMQNLRGQSQGPSLLHFGLGAAELVDEVRSSLRGRECALGARIAHQSRSDRVPPRRARAPRRLPATSGEVT
jgi:hypothetical protein